MTIQNFFMRYFICAIISVGVASHALAQAGMTTLATSADAPVSDVSSSAGGDKIEIAKKLANPIANLVSVPFQWNYDRGRGVNQVGTDQTLLVQPVVPFALSGGDVFILRPIVTSVWLNNVNGYTGAGESNVQIESFYAPYTGTSTIWGIGPYLSSPAGSSGQFGSQQTGGGVTAVILDRKGPWTYGMLGFQSWSLGGVATSGTQNNLYGQPFLAYVTSNAVTYTIQFQSNYNYDVHRTSNPLDFTISKLEYFDKLPIQFTIGARYNVSSIPGGPEGWGARAGITFVFPK